MNEWPDMVIHFTFASSETESQNGEGNETVSDVMSVLFLLHLKALNVYR